MNSSILRHTITMNRNDGWLIFYFVGFIVFTLPMRSFFGNSTRCHKCWNLVHRFLRSFFRAVILTLHHSLSIFLFYSSVIYYKLLSLIDRWKEWNKKELTIWSNDKIQSSIQTVNSVDFSHRYAFSARFVYTYQNSFVFQHFFSDIHSIRFSHTQR